MYKGDVHLLISMAIFFTTLFTDRYLLPCNESLTTDFGLGSARPVQGHPAEVLTLETRTLAVLLLSVVKGIRIANLPVPLSPPKSALREFEVPLPARVPQQEPELVG